MAPSWLDFSAVERVAYNFSLVVLVLFFHYVVRERLTVRRRWVRDAVLGAAFGATKSLSMFLSVPIWDGVILDAKMVLAILAGFFGGWLPALITAVMGGATRAGIGGIGALPGVSGMILAALAGVLMRRRYKTWNGAWRLAVITALGICAGAIQMIAAAMFIPIVGIEAALAIARLTLAPSFLVYVPATVAIGSMFAFVDDRSRTHAELAVTQAELKRTNAELEQRIATRTQELERAHYQLVFAEKMAALGQLTAGIAHELNTPLGAIVSADRVLVATLIDRLPTIAHTYADLDARELHAFEVLVRAGFAQPPQAAEMVTRGARKAALRRLEGSEVAGAEWVAEIMVEYEVGDEVMAMVREARPGVLEAALRAAGELCAMKRSADVISLAAEKAAATVATLRDYTRHDPAEQHELLDIGAEIDTVLALFHNRLKRTVTVERCYAQGAMVRGSREALSQVWVNLIHNALQAIEFQGFLRIETRVEHRRPVDVVVVAVEDDGPGVPESIAARIFEPFFTTKKTGEGMGLGLDICRKVIERHGGTIAFTCGANQGRGTRFEVVLPLICETAGGAE